MGLAQASQFCSDTSSKAAQKMGLDFPSAVSPQVLAEVSGARLVSGSKVGFGFASLEMASALVQGGLLRCVTSVSDTLVTLTNPMVASTPLEDVGCSSMAPLPSSMHASAFMQSGAIPSGLDVICMPLFSLESGSTKAKASKFDGIAYMLMPSIILTT